jgi:hypothetical protein
MNHWRESASIDLAQAAGKIDMKNFCIQLIVLQLRPSIKGEPFAAQISDASTIWGCNKVVSGTSAKIHLNA